MFPDLKISVLYPPQSNSHRVIMTQNTKLGSRDHTVYLALSLCL